MVQQRNPALPLAVQCALLFLAVTVFGWGLQGKLAQYREPVGRMTQSANHAKLTTEDRSARAQLPLSAVAHPECVANAWSLVSLLGGDDALQAPCSRPESGPGTPGRYNLHGPDGLQLPPPAIG